MPSAKKPAPKQVAKRSATKQPRPKSAESSSKAVDEQLARYRSMRDFGITAEPSGGPQKKQEALPFCIQKHAASHLHYDFRLGWNGVLKSWACAKGPSYVVADKRLAVQVEDHPMEYGGFEGIIPAGQYGGGTVMLWDQGTWEPQEGHSDVDAGLRDGSLKFILHGTKMQGKWALIRMGGKAATERKPNWLLIKEHDDFERPPDAPAITEEEPNSVVTKRSLEQIAAQEDHVWNSKDTAKDKAWYRQDSKPATLPDAQQAPVDTAPEPVKRLNFEPIVKHLTPEAQPKFVKPQLALEAETPPAGSGWIHELKLDGYRMQARKDGDKVQMLTRSGLDWTHRVPSVADAVRTLPVDKATLDGEVVVVAENGTTTFADLQASFQDGANHPLTYFCFDLLHLDGHSTRDRQLVDRKALLADLLDGADSNLIRISEHIDTSGEQMFQHACALHAEGIISKRSQSQYSSSRNGDWLKLKCLHEQEFVIGGFTLPSNGIHGIGALLVGYYDGEKLIYAGRTGTGFNQKTHRSVRDQLDSLATAQSPFAAIPTEARKGAKWVKPTVVAQIRFATWTADLQLRQAAFLGIREDKPAKEVVREDAAPTPKRSRQQPAKAAAQRVTPRVAARVAFPPQEQEKAPVRLTHPNKVIDVESGLTKQALADYYWAIATDMLPHIAGRPLSLVRCPEGSGSPCFYQKHVSAMLPKDISTVMVPDKKTGEPEPYITLETPEALAGLAQMGVLEVHPWGSTNTDLEHPDRIVIDLDPDPSLSWSLLAEAAVNVRARLKKLGLESFLKTTGGKGLHIVAPIDPSQDWETVKNFARNIALSMEKTSPNLFLSKMTKAARVGKIYVDYLRNERGATAVAPYSPRARAGAPVSMPLFWKELDTDARPEFHVSNYAEWQSRLKKDPWKSIVTTLQELTTGAVESARKGS